MSGQCWALLKQCLPGDTLKIVCMRWFYILLPSVCWGCMTCGCWKGQDWGPLPVAFHLARVLASTKAFSKSRNTTAEGVAHSVLRSVAMLWTCQVLHWSQFSTILSTILPRQLRREMGWYVPNSFGFWIGIIISFFPVLGKYGSLPWLSNELQECKLTCKTTVWDDGAGNPIRAWCLSRTGFICFS